MPPSIATEPSGKLPDADATNRESAVRLQLALDAGRLGDWSWDVATDVVLLSDRAASIFGLPLGEPITWARMRELLHDEHRERARLAVERALETKTDYDVEYRVTRPAGGSCWIAARGRGTYTEDGAVVGMIGVIEDITGRRQIEEALRRSEQFNRTIIESSRDCIKTLSLEGVVLWISESGCRVLEVDGPQAVVGASWAGFWKPEDQLAARTAVQLAASGGTGNFVGSLLVSDRLRFWDVVITPIRGASGEPVMLLAVSRDVTERMEIERALRDETRVLDVLNKTGTLLASQLDVEGVLQNVTDAATELSGAKLGAFFYNPKDENDALFQLVVLSGASREAFASFGHPRATPLFEPTFRGEGVIRSDDILKDERYGQWAPHHGMPAGHLSVRSYLAVPVLARSGEVLGGLFFGHPSPGVFTARSERIISGIAAQAAIAIDNAQLYAAAQSSAEDRKKLLDSERHARTQAERVSAIKDEFLAVLSHELRTPLSAILGWAHIMRHRAADNEDMLKGLDVIERNARMQTQLIEDLLDMSRISSGKMRLEVHAVAPDAIIEAAAEMVRPAAAAKEIQLELELDRDARSVTGDASRLQQVVWNLLSNAIKFTPKAGTVQVRLSHGPLHVEISVADSGAGIRPEFLPYVFERFRQGDASTTRKHGGLGLGLAIVKQLVELHGGTVRADSAGEGQGATFTVRLPLATESADDATIPMRLPSIPPPSFKSFDLSGLQVVVVDDEPDARTLVARVLEECGAAVLIASRAEDAVKLIEQAQPHVLVSDIGMPDVDGFELLRRVRALGAERGGQLPVIALTAFAREEDRARTLEAGFARHLTKPIELSSLVATVAELSGRGISEQT